MNKKNVAFICVHNSCRSQIAEALGKIILNDICNVYSAGSELKENINQDAVRILKDKFSIDMEEKQKSKLINELPKIDYVITMGCNVSCPNLKSTYQDDWGLNDPTGKNDEEFEKIINIIILKLLNLRQIILRS